MNKFRSITFATLATAALAAQAGTPGWLEADSAAAIARRTASDFTLTPDSALKAINKRYKANFTAADMQRFADKHYIEVKNINGQPRVHRKSVGNFGLLNPEYNDGFKGRGFGANATRRAYVDSVLAYYDGTNKLGAAHKVKYRFKLDVPYNDALEGDTLRVWLPLAINSARQSQVRILEAKPGKYVLSKDAAPNEYANVHNTIYMEQPVVKGQPTHFEYTAEFVSKGQYFSPEYILRNMRPYDKTSEVYRRYTAPEKPHMVTNARIKELAKSIVGNETNPYRQSEMVFDYITRYPWAGAREYSTIECIPEYVLTEEHGDCGQVSLLYISLMRALGVPARWESGWMLHPDEVNYHDWAEVYYEGVGWVPVDASFGRYKTATDPRAVNFYSTGMDAHRFAANLGVAAPLWPNKRYVRSETVDSQIGEVESTRGNLFYPGWDCSFDVLEYTPVARDAEGSVEARVKDAIDQTKRLYAPDKRQVVYEVQPVYGANGTVAMSGKTSEASVKKQLFAALEARGIKAADYVTVLPDTLWAMPLMSVTMNRVEPGHAAEMATQAIMGMPLRVLEKGDDGWLRVQTPDGYISWVAGSGLARKTAAQMAAWRKAPRLVVTSTYQTRAYADAKTTDSRHIVTDLVPGNIVEGSLKKLTNGRTQITLPDGRKAWVDAADVTPIEKWAAQNFNADKVLNQAYSMEGAPYFWGGTSSKHVDCSGLSKTSYLANGIILMRDASQQALTGQRIDASNWRQMEPGDLLFFGNARTGKVTHVAIYDKDGNYVHSSGRVKRNSVDPASATYLTTPFLHAVRINGSEGTNGITYVRNHPWYFDQK